MERRDAPRYILGRWPLVGALLVIASTACGGCGWLCGLAGYARGAPRAEVHDGDGEPRVDVATAAGGLQLLVIRDETSPTVAIQLWGTRGAADEPEGSSGLAATCAELLCLAPALPGVEVDGWASHDATVCEIEAPTELRREAVAHAAALLHGPPERLAERAGQARTAIEERWRRSRSAPRRLLSELAFATVFPGHPYGRPVLRPQGTAPSGERGPESCARWLAGPGAAIVAVGDLTAPSLARELSLGLVGDGAPPARPSLPDGGAERAGPRVGVTAAPVAVSAAAVAFRLPAVSAEEHAALDLLAAAVGGGPASRLGRTALSRSGALHDVHGYVYAGRRGGLLVVAASFFGIDGPTAVRALSAAALGVARAPLAQAEVDEARRLVEASSGTRRAPELARRLGRDAVVGGDPGWSRAWRRGLALATPARLAEVARSRLTVERLGAALLTREHLRDDPAPEVAPLDREGHERLFLDRLEGETRDAIRAVAAALDAPPTVSREAGVARIELAGGPRVVVSESPLASEAAILVGVPSAAAWQAERRAGAPALLAALLARRTGSPDGPRRTREEDVVFDHDAFFVEGSARPDEAGLVVGELVSDLLWAPLEDRLVEELRGDLTARAIERRGSAAEVAREEMLAELHGNRYRLCVDGTVEGLDRLDERQLELARGLVARPDRLVVVVTGRVEPADVARSLTLALASGPAAHVDGAPPSAPEPEERQGARARRREFPTDRSHVLMGFLTGGVSADDGAAREVLAELLSGGPLGLAGRLERDGLASTVEIEHLEGLDAGHLVLHVSTSPSNEARVIDALRALVAELRDNPVPEEALAAARGRAAACAARALALPSARAEALLRAELGGRGPGAAMGWPARLLAVSAADVASECRRLLDADAEVLVVVSNAAPEDEQTAAP